MRCLLILCLLPSLASADWLDLHLTSRHYGADGFRSGGETRAFNSENIGLGLRLPINDNLEATGGAYYNSYYRTSIYAGVSLHTSYSDPVAFALDGGLVTGYENSFILFVRPVISIGDKNTRLALGVIPPDQTSKNPATAFTLSLSFKF